MKGLKHIFTAITLLCIASISIAQSEEVLPNELYVEVFDVVTREPLRDYDFWFIHEQDTLKMHIDSVDNLKIGLEKLDHYEVIVSKEGCGTLSVDFWDLPDSSKAYLEFNVSKVKMNREEKRSVKYHSSNLPPSIFDESQCFSKVKIARKDFYLMRLYAFAPDGIAMSTLEVGQLRDY